MAATPAQVAQLAAGAHSGTAGVQAYNDAQAQVAQSRDAAISGLKATAAQAGAPGALTAQLAAGLAQPASVALANLGEMGGVARSAQDSQNAAQSTYMQEASAALPLVRAEADRDLGQKIALLNASKSGGGGGGRASGAASLSDSELRNRLLGMATAIRQQQIGDLQKRYGVELLATQSQRPTGSGPGEKITGRGSFSDPGNYVNPSVGAPNVYQQALADLQKERVTISQKTNDAYGPGLAGEAQQLGLKAGIDPARVYGVLGPAEDAAYVAANKKLGLYNDPNTQNLTGQTLDPMAAAKQLGYSPVQAQQAAQAKHWIFSSLGSPAYKALSSWLGANPTAVQGVKPEQRDTNGNLRYELLTPEQQAQAQKAFRATPFAQQVATNVVGDVLGDAQIAAGKGLDYRTWQINLMDTPEYGADPAAFKLGFAQAAPLFQYAAALHTRQAANPDPSLYDPTAYVPTGG